MKRYHEPGRPCLCGAQDCPSCGPAQGYDPLDFAIDEMADEVVAEWLADRKQFSEYAAGFSDETWERFESAIAACSDVEACEIYRQAIREQMKDDAREEARQRVLAQIEDDKMAAAEHRGWAMADE